MTEQDSNKKVLSLGGRPKLELKKPVSTDSPTAAGSVKQSFSHGRSKTVAVEVKRGNRAATAPTGDTVRAATTVKGPEPGTSVTMGGRGRATSAIIRQLTPEERDARARALRGAAENERAPQEAATQAPQIPVGGAPVYQPPSQDALRQRELDELRRIQEQEKVEGERRRVEDEARGRDLQARRANETSERSGRASGEGASQMRGAALAARAGHAPRTTTEEEEEGGNRGNNRKPGRNTTRTRGDDDRRGGARLTVSQALSDEDGGGRHRSVASMRRRIEREKRQAMQSRQEQQKVTRDVTIPEAITVQELANRMAERGVDVIKSLMKMGMMVTITQVIDADTAELIATEFGHRVKRVAESDIETNLSGVEDAPEQLQPRPPVVTVMGHVDHGKTSLLDALRNADVVAGEAGGITQHIGAYQVVMPEPMHGFDRVTFIDTPGHAAFTEMRSRGAHITDVVVLVVAADDGIMPQTIEAIRHAKAAGVPLVVAINKCDLPAAKPDRVRQELLQHDIQVEEMGGDVLSVEISAKKRMNLDKLLEAILLQAEILDLKANPDRVAEGAVVESKLERGRGAVATVLVRRGTLSVGDIFVAGSEWGRVRALIDDHGRNVVKAGPAMPVEVLGLNGAPQAGDELLVVADEAKAREIAEFRERRKRTLASAASQRGTLEQMMENIKAGSVKELAILIKGDVHGSVEAIKGALIKLTDDNNEVRVRVLDAAVGAITESDITLAKASHAMIIGFNVRANQQAREMAKRDAVELRYYSIIYNVIDDVKQALSGLLAPTLREKFLGNALILQVFNISRVGKVAGCKVTEGIVKRGAKVRLLRDNVVIHEGSLKTLKRVKDEVKEVREGFECGMAFENYDGIEANDIIECFEMEEIARQL
ncbi:MAG: translation initiation factor IF-2 [Alphaproteobacteria bacterium]|nr:translation initiation factor IF-2 [Alphaproteobacteria bacterium]MBV8548220.1 translation initiation factor IF-2 [Alphaproteobacteria bacterium]